ncbi:MAG TPA: Ig-like domain-containing protein, partial [Thermomicrobiales bacterium]|nr:Ig-like domain-containing protein [Thermomicrobiales bacterium]
MLALLLLAGVASTSSSRVAAAGVVAQNVTFSTGADTPYTGTLAGKASGGLEPYSYYLDAGPTHGTLTQPLSDTGAFTYTPSAGYNGLDSFTYHAEDGDGRSSPIATVKLEVGSPPLTLNGVAGPVTVPVGSTVIPGSDSGAVIAFWSNPTCSGTPFLAHIIPGGTVTIAR